MQSCGGREVAVKYGGWGGGVAVSQLDTVKATAKVYQRQKLGKLAVV